ncbi:twitching motility protein PilT [Bacteroidia bacterium]|nr:twitching motility protein PilT [Bacteroidia bacterium]
MRYLIDTNILIGISIEPSLLSPNVKSILEDYSNLLYISSESVKEMIHLVQTGKIKNQKWKIAQDIIDSIEKEWNIGIKYIRKEHLMAFARLNRVNDHNDPSDRLIIAQAIAEKIPLISADGKFHHYRKQNLQFVFNKR